MERACQWGHFVHVSNCRGVWRICSLSCNCSAPLGTSESFWEISLWGWHMVEVQNINKINIQRQHSRWYSFDRNRGAACWIIHWWYIQKTKSLYLGLVLLPEKLIMDSKSNEEWHFPPSTTYRSRLQPKADMALCLTTSICRKVSHFCVVK